MDLPIQKGKEGYIGLRDFSGMILKAFEDAGFIYHSRVTIWKNPVTEMQRTKALGLLHKQLKKDSAMSRVGIPDYLMVFRKEGDHQHPVRCNIDVDTWQKWASPVWMDIDYSNTLNKMNARGEKDEKHIFDLASGGFSSTVRLAKSSPDMWTPILTQNKENVLHVMDTYIEKMNAFRQAVAEGDEEAIRSLIEEANRIRRIIR